MSSPDLASSVNVNSTDTSGRGLLRHLDAALLSACAATFGRSAQGRVRMTMPSGRSAVIGQSLSGSHGDGADATLEMTSYKVISRSLRRGALGFAESFMAGDARTDSLQRLFEFFMDNQRTLESAGRGLFEVRLPDRMFHRRRSNTRQGSKRNIAAHYDLGNDFYRLWLDESLTYSSGIYPDASTSLEAAQALKYQRILQALAATPGQRLLEIGCGWGSFAMAAARLGLAVTGITISAAQLAEAQSRLAVAGLSGSGPGLAQIQFEDYRDTTGTYDRIASIEMIEAVGEEHWPTYFKLISDRLAPGGVAVIQAITIREELADVYRAKPDFIQRYIFPGGVLPTVAAMKAHTQAAGMAFDVVETFGASYAHTLVEWRKRFVDAWPRIEALGFDDRFRRMWEYYLAYCEVGFNRGLIDVGLYRLRKAA